MYLWNRYKFLIIFVILIVGAPFLMTKVSKTFLQGAQTISTESSPCLKNNPPTIWVEKDPNSRKGYASSGIKNTELLLLNLVTCGEVNIKEMSFIIESRDMSDVIAGADFTLSVFGQNFFMKSITEYGGDKALVSFEFEQPVSISFLGSTQKARLLGTFPNSHSGKTTFTFSNIALVGGENSTISINRASSSLVFVKKE